MILTPKVKNILAVVYVVFMLLGAFYIHSISKYTKIEQATAPKTNPTKSKPVNTTLIINESKTYTASLQSSDSVSYMLDQLRKNNSFDYEKTRYTYGTEIDSVNGVKASEGYKWEVFLENKDITPQISEINLVDGVVYKLNLVKP